jgi:peptidoglycan/xylan/chitin deacetylase (PgdA/CDA1 family)
MEAGRKRPGWTGTVALMVLFGLGGCAELPKAPLPDEGQIGPPLPYEPPAMVLKSAPALTPIPPQVVRSGSRRKKRVALTFDACSTEGPGRFDVGVIRALIDAKAPATLFLGGKWMEEYPDETMELARHSQFELANHTYHHPHLRRESNERVREEIQRTQDLLYTLTGRTARLFRAPYVELDARVARLVGEQGLISVQTDLASGDPDPRIGARRLADYVLDRAKNGSIVIMHMNGRGWHTAEALPRIILKLRKKGFRLVTVSELLGLPPAPAPAQGLSAR